MAKRRCFIYIVIGILACAAMLAQSQAATINVLSSTNYTNILGYYHIVGEVQNTGASAVRFVKVTASLYSSNGSFIDSEYTYIKLDVLNSNAKSPFDISYSQTSKVPQIDHYTLNIEYSTTSAKPAYLKLLSNSTYTDTAGYIKVVGEIQNKASGNSSYNEITATFYDSTGKAVATDYTFTSPSTMTANQTAPYSITLFEKSRNSIITNYEVTAESIEYSLITDTNPTPTATPSPTPSHSPSPTPSPTPSQSPTPTALASPTPTLTLIPTQSTQPSNSQNPTASPSLSQQQTFSPDPTATPSPTVPEFPLTPIMLVVILVTLAAGLLTTKKRERDASGNQTFVNLIP